MLLYRAKEMNEAKGSTGKADSSLVYTSASKEGKTAVSVDRNSGQLQPPCSERTSWTVVMGFNEPLSLFLNARGVVMELLRSQDG